MAHIQSLKNKKWDCPNMPKVWASIYQVEAWIAWDNGDLALADSVMQIVLHHAEDSKDSLVLLDGRGNYSSILMAMGKTNEGLSLMHKCINEYPLDKYSLRALPIYANITGIYNRINNFPKALEMGLKGLTYAQHETNYNYHTLLNNLGSTYLNLEDYTNAEDTFKKSINLCKKADNPNSLSFALYGISTLHYKKNEYSKAEKYYLELAELEEKHGYQANLADTYVAIARNYVRMDNVVKAEIFLDKADKILTKLDLPKEKIKHSEVAALVVLYKTDKKAYHALVKSIDDREKEFEET